MSELRNRRQAVQEELGLNDSKERFEIERSIQKEEKRKAAKERKRMQIEESASYRATQNIAKYMDKWYLDAFIGFIPGGIWDFLTQILIFPYIYVSAVQIRSVPLTLAIIYNALRDIAIGLIPFWIGNILDFFNRSYLQNIRLIVGFVEDDKEIIDEVNRKAVRSAILIVVFCMIIVLLLVLIMKIANWITGLFS
ncbi:DUF4112 domain-containing protein [uncultured Prevotella sp.]|uniref:DUF4112 domain-containing protein n=1 Tax=uncultured Prevotella sp. TaxID=159272 RepID=UPI0026111077|nr:DUF4112 domain-containing protein [uncultured Prevotella sp.]